MIQFWLPTIVRYGLLLHGKNQVSHAERLFLAAILQTATKML